MSVLQKNILTDEKEELGLIVYWNLLEHCILNNFNKSTNKTNEQRRFQIDDDHNQRCLMNPFEIVFE